MTGEKLNADSNNTRCCVDVSGNRSQEPMEAGCFVKEGSGEGNEGEFELDLNATSGDGCVGDGVLTQDIREDEKDRLGFVAVEVQGTGVASMALGGNTLIAGVDARKCLKRARLRAWKK